MPVRRKIKFIPIQGKTSGNILNNYRQYSKGFLEEIRQKIK